MSNLQTYYHFKLDFQKVDQHRYIFFSVIRSGYNFLWLETAELSLHVQIFNQILLSYQKLEKKLMGVTSWFH